MESALSWPFTSPQLIAIYASQLAELKTQDAETSRRNVDRALDILARACPAYPELQISLANLAAKHGRKQSLERVAKNAKEQIRARMENDTATVEDLTSLANLFLLEQDADKALKVCEMGIKRDPEDPSLRRIQSEAFRLKYLKSLVLDGEKVDVNLAFLDAALKSDPTNPGVSLEVAKLLAAGKDTPAEMKEVLQKQVASGQATALAHILLADRHIMESNIGEAIPHLEAALRQAPDSPLVLNNLSLALARTNPEVATMERALAMAKQAVSLAPDDAEYRDTLGEIQWQTGDKLGALASYEAAVGLEPTRLATRESLVKLYRELGMSEMAETQAAEIERLAKQARQPQANK
jgi:tetratricopeptide (TPR) repeat protein